MRKFWEDHPLKSILLIGLIVRIIAVFLSQGYLMHDDHFLVIEPASSWVVGEDHDRWLPWNMKEGDSIHAFNFAYVGSQFLLLKGMYEIGIQNPKVQMIIIRFLHALYSLFIILYGFKITRKLSNLKTARTVGIILALLAFMPNFSVRQLVEMACIPPIMWGFWKLIQHRESKAILSYVLAGIGLGIATGIRYQCGVFGIGLGLAMLVEKNLKGATIVGIVSLMVFSIMQLPDIFVWGKPFTQLQAYINYNIGHRNDYTSGPWYKFILTTLGFLIPPISVFIAIGFFKEWKKQLVIFLPVLIFLLFHSAFPNKQERFILPAFPLLISLGLIGWNNLVAKKGWEKTRKGLLKFSWRFFWVTNSLALVLFTMAYTKKSRVEVMSHFYNTGELKNFVTVAANKTVMPPQYYSGIWCRYIDFQSHQKMEWINEVANRKPEGQKPNFVIFFGSKDVPAKVKEVKEYWPNIQFVKKYNPGMLDKILHFLNDKNTLEEAHIYSLPISDIKREQPD